METMPQAIPNMVRNVRSLWDHSVRKHIADEIAENHVVMDADAART